MELPRPTRTAATAETPPPSWSARLLHRNFKQQPHPNLIAGLSRMRKVTLAVLLLLAVGIVDHLYAATSAADPTVRRLGLHQDKSQAYWLYFFIAHIYDGVLNPWHWTEQVRHRLCLVFPLPSWRLRQFISVRFCRCGTMRSSTRTC